MTYFEAIMLIENALDLDDSDILALLCDYLDEYVHTSPDDFYQWVRTQERA